jgi:hypothetical protein
LKHLDPPEPADEDPVRAGAENDHHCRVARLEQRPPDVRQKLGDHFWIRHAYAGIDLQCHEAEIE